MIDYGNIPTETSNLANLTGWMHYTLYHNPQSKKLVKKPAQRGWQHSQDSLDLCLWKSRNNPDWLPGLSLNPDTNKLILIDFDNVKVGGDFTAEAMGYVKKANTLTEVSASGNGLHCIATANVDKNYRNKYSLNRGQCEVYWESRFIALTFDWRLDTPQSLENFDSIPKILPFVYEVDKHERTSLDRFGDAIGYGETPKYPIQKSTFALLNHYLRKGKNGNNFNRLYNGAFIHDGEWISTKKYPSQSEGDLGLVALGMYYANSEHFHRKYLEDLDGYDGRGLAYSLCDKMMRRSELYRSKWKRFDYRVATLNLAYESQTEPYNPVRYFDKHYRDGFSDIQSWRQNLSKNKRVESNQQRILDAIDILSDMGDKITKVAIMNKSGLKEYAVNHNLQKLGIKVASGKATFSKTLG